MQAVDRYVEVFEHLPDAPDLRGQITIRDYKPVYAGPYSVVYRGELRKGDRAKTNQVAIKVLKMAKGDMTTLRKLERERKAWAALRHRNILPLYGFVNDSDLFKPFGALVSPWLQRGNAVDFLAEGGFAITSEERIGLWKQVIAGVQYMHSYNPALIHGDLKPPNILIDDSGNAQICDFGLVRIFLDEGSCGMATTTEHTGTARYLSYELVDTEEAYPTAASDIYAVGCIGLEFIFSRVPHSTRPNNLRGVIYRDIKARKLPASRPTYLTPRLADIWTLFEHCWNLDPLHRPSAASLLAHLEQRIDYLPFSIPEPAKESASSGNAVHGIRDAVGSVAGTGDLPKMQRYPMSMPAAGNMDSPPTSGNEGLSLLPTGLGAASATAMRHSGTMGVGSVEHGFGMKRLLQFNARLRDLSGYDSDKWSSIIAENFTENATFGFRVLRRNNPTNPYVNLPFPLIIRFFATLTQSHVNHMPFVLDGAIERQIGLESMVFCPTARWPMQYDNGYILELGGTLRARCRSTLVTLPTTSDQHNLASSSVPNLTPQMSYVVPASPGANGMEFSPPNSNNIDMNSSPSIAEGAVPDVSEAPEVFITSTSFPYVVEIEELSFETASLSISLDFGLHQDSSNQPDTIYGIPRPTMRLIEFVEGMQALEPLMGFEDMTRVNSPLDALKEYAEEYADVTLGNK